MTYGGLSSRFILLSTFDIPFQTQRCTVTLTPCQHFSYEINNYLSLSQVQITEMAFSEQEVLINEQSTIQ